MDVLIDEVANVVSTRTKSTSTRIVINKLSGRSVYFTVYYDPSYAFDSANVVLYSDNNNMGTVTVDSIQASSTKGFSGVITTDMSLGYEVILRLENCVFQGEDVAIDIRTKFVN